MLINNHVHFFKHNFFNRYRGIDNSRVMMLFNINNKKVAKTKSSIALNSIDRVKVVSVSMFSTLTGTDDLRYPRLSQLSSSQRFESDWQRPQQLAKLIEELEYANDLDESFSDFEEDYFWHDYGRVVSVIDGIATVYGLKRIKAGHMVTFFNSHFVSGHSQLQMTSTEVETWLDDSSSVVDSAFDAVSSIANDSAELANTSPANDNIDSYISGTGIALNLEKDFVGVVLLGPDTWIFAGDLCATAKQPMEISVGWSLLGRIIDALGNPVDGKGELVSIDSRQAVEKKAPGIVSRKSIHEPLQTGLKAIDALFPIGRGQRELILGEGKLVKRLLRLIPLLIRVRYTK